MRLVALSPEDLPPQHNYFFVDLVLQSNAMITDVATFIIDIKKVAK